MAFRLPLQPSHGIAQAVTSARKRSVASTEAANWPIVAGVANPPGPKDYSAGDQAGRRRGLVTTSAYCRRAALRAVASGHADEAPWLWFITTPSHQLTSMKLRRATAVTAASMASRVRVGTTTSVGAAK